MPKANIEERAEDFCFDKHGPLGCSTDKADRPCKECFVKAIAAFSTAGLRKQIAEICNAVGVDPEREVEEAARRQYRRYSLQEINQHQAPSKKANTLTATAPTTSRPYESDATAMSRALNVIDALPAAFRMAEATPLRDALPGIWPTVGDLRACLAAPEPAAGGEREIVRHLKRGTEYEVLHQGVELQVAVARGEPRELLETTLAPDPVCWEGDRLVVYRGADGKLWAREESEFRDGRFETVTDPRPVPAEPQVSGGWSFDMEAAPRDGTPIQVAVEGREGEEPIVGEAYFEESTQALWWTNEGPGDYHASPIHETLSYPYAWKPLDKAPAPPESPAGAEGGR